MSHIHINTIGRENVVHFFEECGACCFNTVDFPHSKDVITLYGFLVHGRDMFDMVKVNAFRVNDKLIAIDADRDCRNIFRTFDGSI